MKHGQFTLLLIMTLVCRMPAQDKDSIAVALQPIVVTASRMPINALYVNRSIDIIDERMIQNSGAACVEELLQKGANIDIQPRGIFGVQSDISLRGTIFSQQLILLNNVRLNDVQTAHHNFDLPISVDQIERIEVLKGAGSALYGPDAYGGVINIITKIPEEQALRLKLSGGENGLVNALTSYDFSSTWIHSSNTIEHRRSDGYHFDTDFQITSVSTNNLLELPIGTFSIFGGYTNKAFGAFNFYGPSPSKEWTETTFLNIATEFTCPSILLQPKLSYRRHYDKFMYDLHNPNSLNINTTNFYNGVLQSIIQLHESASLIAGIDGNVDNIISTNLRDHVRSSIGAFAAFHSVIRKNILLDIGMREDLHSEYGQQFNPSMNIGYLFSQNVKIFVTAGRSFRAPSYTELYYSSPYRIGDADLKPETGWSYEAGTEYIIHPLARITMSLFERNQENLIDYVKFTAADIASRAMNFTSAVTRGAEINFRWNNASISDPVSTGNMTLQNLLISYTYLDSRIDMRKIYSSVYSFTHPRHQFGIGLSGIIPLAVGWTANAIHKIKLDGKSYTLVDAKFSRMLFHVTIFLQGTNLLNQSYEEISGVPLPGRWLWAGVEFRVL